MPWTSKERPSFLETQPLPGLLYLDGDLLTEQYRQERLRGKSIPLMTYPSGLKRELLQVQSRPTVHLFDKVHLFLDADKATAFEATEMLAKELGHTIQSIDDESFEVWQRGSGGRYMITCDNRAGQVTNVSFG